MLIEHILEKDEKQEYSGSNTHRIFCIDCSGSMGESLELLRTQLKNKISKLIQPNDFFSLVWFSGKGQFGTIFEHISINDVTDLSNIHQSIDKYIRTVGSTGFVEPIRLCKELSQKYNELPQVFFLSDGGENTWPINECENAFREMSGIPTIIVEYQYYCDRVLLKRLAEYSNGISIFNETFESFKETFDTYMRNRVSISRRFDTTLPIIYFDDDTLVFKNIKNDETFINIPNHIEKVWQVDEKPFHFETDERDKHSDLVKQVYLTMLYALHTKSKNMMEYCVNILGDVHISKLYSTCFSKQDYSNLTQHITNCVKNPSDFAFLKGVDLNYKPNHNFNVIELLNLLSEDEKARFYPYRVDYNRISREVKKEKTFFPNRDVGVRFTLVSNQSRANLSFGCQVYGHQIDENDEISPVTAYRNYTVLKDGIKNLTILPFTFSQETFTRLQKENCISSITSSTPYEKGTIYNIDLTDLPVVNRQMVSSPISSVEFCRKHIDLFKTKASLKYLKYLKKMVEKEDEKDDDKKEEKKEEREYAKKDPNIVRDFYTANELQVKISKCSTVPTINDKLLEKLSKGSKLTLSESVLIDLHSQYSQYSQLDEKKNWIDNSIKDYKQKQTDLTSTLEQAKIALLIGGVWFSDCSFDTKTFKVDEFEVTVEMNDCKVYMD